MTTSTPPAVLAFLHINEQRASAIIDAQAAVRAGVEDERRADYLVWLDARAVAAVGPAWDAVHAGLDAALAAEDLEAAAAMRRCTDALNASIARTSALHGLPHPAAG